MTVSRNIWATVAVSAFCKGSSRGKDLIARKSQVSRRPTRSCQAVRRGLALLGSVVHSSPSFPGISAPRACWPSPSTCSKFEIPTSESARSESGKRLSARTPTMKSTSQLQNMHGSCICGAIRITATEPDPTQLTNAPDNVKRFIKRDQEGRWRVYVGYCSCESCMRSNGSVIAVELFFPKGTVQFEDQGGKLREYNSSAKVARKRVGCSSRS